MLRKKIFIRINCPPPSLHPPTCVCSDLGVFCEANSDINSIFNTAILTDRPQIPSPCATVFEVPFVSH